MKNNYEEWTKEFLESWKNLDYQRTLKTLDPNVVYYENPMDAPCKNFDEVTALWNVVATNQKEIDYQGQPLVHPGPPFNRGQYPHQNPGQDAKDQAWQPDGYGIGRPLIHIGSHIPCIQN